MDSEEKTETKSTSDLTKLALRYFTKAGYKMRQDMVALEGFSGISRKFDLIIQKGRIVQGVWIRDWNRTIGINVVINLDKACEDTRLSNPILVGENFSDHAKAYANRRKITLLTKQQMILSLR